MTKMILNPYTEVKSGIRKEGKPQNSRKNPIGGTQGQQKLNTQPFCLSPQPQEGFWLKNSENGRKK